MKAKKDRIFVVVLAIVAANLAYQAIWLAVGVTAGLWANLSVWLLLVANVVGFAGVLWLIRSYRRGRRIDKEEVSSKSNQEKHSKT